MTVDLASLLVGAGIGVVVTLAATVVVAITRPRSSSALPEAVTEPEVESLQRKLEAHAETQKQEVQNETSRMVRARDLDDLGRLFDES